MSNRDKLCLTVDCYCWRSYCRRNVSFYTTLSCYHQANFLTDLHTMQLIWTNKRLGHNCAKNNLIPGHETTFERFWLSNLAIESSSDLWRITASVPLTFTKTYWQLAHQRKTRWWSWSAQCWGGRHKIVRNFGSVVGPIFKKLKCYLSVYLKFQSLLHVFKTCSDWITLFSKCSIWYGFRSSANAIRRSREHDLNRA